LLTSYPLAQAARAVTRLSEDKVKYKPGDCEALGKESLKCIEDHGYIRDPSCKPFFEAYTECKKAVTAARRNQNK
jgi:hypothetical protein